MPKLQVNGIELYYEITGEGQPVMLIHGLGSSTRDWEHQIADFAQKYQVITVDMRGHGQSTTSAEPYTIRLFAEDSAELIRSLNIAPVHIVGISMGGMIAFQLAVIAPELIKSMVIVNAAPELIVQGWRDRLKLLQRQLIVRVLGMRKIGEVLGKRMFPKPEHAELRQTFADRWAENDTKTYLASMQAIVGWSVTAHLDEITCPILVVAADQDYTPVAQKEAYVAKLPNAQLVIIEDSRHATPVEHPQQFNQVVLEFLQS